MIVLLRGTLLEATPTTAVVEAGGVGYEVAITAHAAGRLPATGQEVVLHVHSVYREDAQLLYGFASREERDFFRLLIDKVGGVGPKVALAAVGGMTLPALVDAIRRQDVAMLSRINGIGKKTAERIVVELRDVVGSLGSLPAGRAAAPLAAEAVAPGEGAVADATRALVQLGHRAPDVEAAVRKAVAQLGPEADAGALVRAVLRGVAKS